jgi:ribonuclease Z
MKANPKTKSGLTRREYIRLSGLLALGGLAAGGDPRGRGHGHNPHEEDVGNCYPTNYNTERYSYFEKLRPFDPRTPLEPNEMRISFMGSVVPPFGRAQRMMSVFVEVGWVHDTYRENQPGNTTPAYKAQDQAIFDCGPGCLGNYISMNVHFHRMNKIFVNHLHGDHIGELPGIYGLGGGARMSPLIIWGNGPTGEEGNPYAIPNPGNTPDRSGSDYPEDDKYSDDPPYYVDGTQAFCSYFREANRWQSEAFSFQATAYASYRNYDPPTKETWGLPHDPIPVGDDPHNDAYAIIPIELDWWKTGLDAAGKPDDSTIAYWNQNTGLKISHFPVIHCRKGSLGYKVEWTPPGASKPLTMIYTSDTKPDWNSVLHAANGGKGVDVFIHEMALPPEIWAMKCQGASTPDEVSDTAVDRMAEIQNSSHTTQGAFGYLLSEIKARSRLPRLSVATHFPTTDDTVACALRSVHAHVAEIDKVGEKLTWSYDCMIIRVFPDRIEQHRADISDYNYSQLPTYTFYDPLIPKYRTDEGEGDPYGQIDRTYEIQSTEDINTPGVVTYRKDGY